MTARNATLTLYARKHSVHSHLIRLVCAEKGVADYRLVELREGQTDDDLVQVNPYNSVPTLIDRDLVLYDPRVIIEYLDERYPHPPLMPVDPAMRARYRMAIYRINRDLYQLTPDMQGTPAVVRRTRKRLKEMLLSLAAEFAPKPYVGGEFSLMDCGLAPVLWRLKHYKIELPPKRGQALSDYAQRLFARPAFAQSLTDDEKEMAG